MRKMKLCAVALIVPVLLSGCAKTIVVTATELCKDWQHQSVSKNDKLTQGTAANMEASNKSRPNWGCAYGKNEAGG